MEIRGKLDDRNLSHVAAAGCTLKSGHFSSFFFFVFH